MTQTIEAACLGRQLRYRPLRVRTPDGVTLAVQDWGRGGGLRDVLFVHGFSQSHLAWLKQVTGPLADDFRLVTYDNRGHGLSDKPSEPEAYRDPKRWADEVRSVIERAELTRPVLVAWSYSGRIVLDYLAAYGDAAISGLVMVSATSKADPSVLGPAAPVLRGMGSPDLGTSLAATRGLLTLCTPRPLPPEEFALMMGYNAMTPPFVRSAMGGRPADYDDVLRGLTVPVLVLHGDGDLVNLPAMSEHSASLIPNCTHRVYRGLGHLPFWEDPGQFDTDVGQFMRLLA